MYTCQIDKGHHQLDKVFLYKQAYKVRHKSEILYLKHDYFLEHDYLQVDVHPPEFWVRGDL